MVFYRQTLLEACANGIFQYLVKKPDAQINGRPLHDWS